MSVDLLDAAAPDRGGVLFAEAWFPAPPGRDHRHGWDLRLAELAARAQPEPWDDPTEPIGGLPVLSNYLRYTYARIKEEDKLLVGVDEHGIRVAAFNTGLFTPHFEPLICLLEANRNPQHQPWVFKAWVTPTDLRLRLLEVDDLRPAYYFEDSRDLVFDPRLELVSNLDHILEHRSERWPPQVPDDEVQRRLMLDGAIREAAKRIQMNWRLAVPQFYWPRGRHDGRIQLLIPLRLSAAKPADLALVVDRQGQRYVGYTILTLSMAYRNARLVAWPESDWLTLPAAPFPDAVEFDEDAAPKWRRVSSGDRCPICGQATKCAISADNHSVVCWRNSVGGEPVRTGNGATVWLHDDCQSRE